MRRRWWIGLPLLGGLLAAVLALQPCPAFACSCAAGQTPQQALDGATTVFSGVVTDIAPARGAIWSSADPVRVTFAVSEVWKGPAIKQISSVTARESASCGYTFRANGEYLVYAQEIDGVLQVSLCSRTQFLAEANEDLNVLGAGTTELTAVSVASDQPAPSVPAASAPPPTAPTSSVGEPRWMWIGGAAVIATVLGGVLVAMYFLRRTG